tara:strand:- start:227 stop:562 length:336 start_codon:yes stop_codon:yes gene_type:complete
MNNTYTKKLKTFINSLSYYLIFVIGISFLVFCVMGLLNVYDYLDRDISYHITCTENGEVIFESEQKSSFGFDGYNRQVRIYDGDKHIKTITFNENTSCNETYSYNDNKIKQ